MALDLPGVSRPVPTPEAAASYLEGCAPLWDRLRLKPTRPAVRFLARGAGNAVFAFEAGGEPLVLRVALAANTQGSRVQQVEQEARVLEALQGREIVPRLLHVELGDAHPLGGPLLILEHLQGRTLDYRPEDLEAAGRLHALLHSAALAPEGVPRRPRPVQHLLHDALQWFDLYAASPRANPRSVQLFAQAIERCLALDRPALHPVLVHGDATCWNFIATPRGLRLIDWEWCRLSDPIEDPSHFLSPITTARLRGRLLTEVEENIYINSYTKINKSHLSTQDFREALNAHRPAIVLHSATWTAAWLVHASPEAHTRDDDDGLRYSQLAWQVEPAFLELLTQRGLW